MGHVITPLFGLAPSGVYPATDVATSAVRSYRTISPLPARLAVYFLWHFPSARAAQALPGTLPCWSPDFPPVFAYWRLPGRLSPPILPDS